jgi:hypothetical protein
MADQNYAMSEYLAIAVDKLAKGSQTPISGCATPNIGMVGVGMKTVSGSSFMEAIEASTSHFPTVSKLDAIIPTPTGGPIDQTWVDHQVDADALAKYRDTFEKGKSWFGKGHRAVESLDDTPKPSYAFIVSNRGKHN